ncbi:MAG: aminotransferase class V-fold PLP-dependent enzyme [Candidatus Marinimicrobia bacterium]|nr:aminotransferase class V-fold PLP-dependent enzyme [Candidatus Neomarinimicrobiota bacterium]
MSYKRVYLDHNATTPIHPEVKKYMVDKFDLFGNPSSMHEFGREARQEVEKNRKIIADFINASPDEIIFVGSGSEANNTVLSLSACPLKSCNIKGLIKPKLITSRIEHPAVLETVKCLNGKSAEVEYVDVDSQGKIKLDQLEAMLRKEQALIVSIMTANNEIGTIQNIKEIAALVHQYQAYFHTDAVQAAGKIDIDVKDWDVDFLTLSAHKIYGPKGIGALYIKKGVPFCPLIYGGHQEEGRRAGTENSLGILGFGKAVEMRKIEMKDEGIRLLKLKNKLKAGIIEKVSHTKVVGHEKDCIPGTLNISFEGVEGESILLYLDLMGIAVSTGSACSSGSLEPSHVILATGLDAEFAHGSIRFSLGRDTTEDEIDYVLDTLPGIIGKLRKMSTRELRS